MRRVLVPPMLAVAVLLVPALAVAGDWQEPAEVRLIDGGVLADGLTRLAGLEILLDPGWKTYWRDPGDSGVPPHFDFSGSGNLAGVAVEWPAPEVHFDGFGWVIGYTDAVIFPLLVTAQADGPVDLKLKLDYAVCKEICIPAEAEVETTLDGSMPRPAEIAFFRGQVPKRIDHVTEAGGIISFVVDRSADVAVLELRLRFPGDAEDAFAVVEGPEDWYLPVPERTGVDGQGEAVFRVPLDGAPDPASISGAEMRVTGVSPAFSFEQILTLD